eukprot:2419591-Rhodomonas_salina.1
MTTPDPASPTPLPLIPRASRLTLQGALSHPRRAGWAQGGARQGQGAAPYFNCQRLPPVKSSGSESMDLGMGRAAGGKVGAKGTCPHSPTSARTDATRDHHPPTLWTRTLPAPGCARWGGWCEHGVAGAMGEGAEAAGEA